MVWESFLLYGDLEQKKAPEATNLGSFVPMPNWFQPSLFMAGQVRGILCEQDQAACLHVSRGQKERERRAFLVPAETVLPCLYLRVYRWKIRTLSYVDLEACCLFLEDAHFGRCSGPSCGGRFWPCGKSLRVRLDSLTRGMLFRGMLVTRIFFCLEVVDPTDEWALITSSRFPTALSFNPEDSVHMDFILAAANLKAQVQR